MKLIKNVGAFLALSATIAMLPGCVTVREDSGGTSYRPDLSGRANKVVHEAQSPLGPVLLKKDLFGSDHWIEIPNQKYENAFPEDLRSAHLERNYGDPNEALLVYRYTADGCPVGYKLLAVTQEKMYTAKMGDCIRELDIKTDRAHLVATAAPDQRLDGYRWRYERGQAHMTVAKLVPETRPAASRSGSSASQSPRSSTSTTASPQRGTVGTRSRSGTTEPSAVSRPSAPKAPATPVRAHQKLPTDTLSLPTEVDVVHEPGHSAPTVVLN